MHRRLDESGSGHTDRGHAQQTGRVLYVLAELSEELFQMVFKRRFDQ